MNIPDIVVIPELAVANYFESRLRQYAQKLGAIIIAGLDLYNVRIIKLRIRLCSIFQETGRKKRMLES